MSDFENETDICRVCRCEGSSDKPLFHPCVCTGSIKYIHQDCLVKWLKITRKSYCELCRHQFQFRPIYRPDTPTIVPVREIAAGIAHSIGRCVKTWLHCTMVAFIWLGVVPLTSCRIYNFFLSSTPSALSSMYNLFRMDNFLADVIEGCVIVTAVLLLFISLVWLKDQVQSNAPEWLQNNEGDLAEQALQDEARDENDLNINGVEEHADDEDEDDEDENNNNRNPNENVPEQLPDNNAEPAADPGPNEAGAAFVPPVVVDQGANNNQGVWILGGDEMTWDRVLGLDGSYVFLEHALWIVTLNLMFILFFAFLPSQVGHQVCNFIGLSNTFTESQFQRPVETFFGYISISAFLCLFYVVCPLFSLRRQTARVIGQMYLISKVLLLIVIEICVFPIACGWWLDVLTLRVFGSTLGKRVAAFTLSPWTSTLVHWTVGMIFVFYLASSFMLLRELLRPGVLWFLRNINDPEFNPIVEMIQFPVYRHVRRIAMSIVMFGCLSTLVIHCPVRAIFSNLPSMFPYRFPPIHSQTFPLHLLSQLFLLNLVLPALLDPGHTRLWAKAILSLWLRVFGSKLLGLRSYLFGSRNGETPINNGNNNQPANNNNNPPNNHDNQAAGGQLAELHQQMIDVQMRRDQAENEPFEKPEFFNLRVALLLALGSASLFLAGLIMFLLPVWIGRFSLEHLFGMEPAMIHDLYSVSVGLVELYIFGRGFEFFLSHILSSSWDELISKAKLITFKAGKISVILGFVFGILPVMLGALLDAYLLAAFRAPLLSTPITEKVQIWVIGIVQVKLLAAVVVMGPRNRVREAIEDIAGMGNGQIPLKTIILDLFIPAMAIAGFLLSAPYVIANSLIPMLHLRSDLEAICQRLVHCLILSSSLVALVVIFQMKQLRALYFRIKNDKYMVGHRLMNYNTETKQYLSE